MNFKLPSPKALFWECMTGITLLGGLASCSQNDTGVVLDPDNVKDGVEVLSVREAEWGKWKELEVINPEGHRMLVNVHDIKNPNVITVDEIEEARLFDPTHEHSAAYQSEPLSLEDASWGTKERMLKEGYDQEQAKDFKETAGTIFKKAERTVRFPDFRAGHNHK